MKYLLAFVLIAIYCAACASGPTKILMKNCDDMGNGVFSCEEIPRPVRERAFEPPIF